MEWRPASPRTVAEAILAGLFDGDDGAPFAAQQPTPEPSGAFVNNGPTGDFELTDHQESAVRRARGIMQRRGGVIIADAVGLGKTYVALALVREELSRGGRVAVVVPAALRDQWRVALERALGHRGGDRASGADGGCPIHLVSHTRLSRGSVLGRAGDQGTVAPTLVVVDEAHRFRNPDTHRYRALARVCSASRVVLLTATPVNNGVADLLHLIRLFAPDDAFRDLGVPGLAAAFEAAAAGKRGAAAAPPTAMAEVRRVVRAVVVRRTRAMIRPAPPSAAGPVLRFPRRAPPSVVRYPDPGVAALARAVARLELAAYDAPSPGAPGSGSALVRLGLLRRLDSSRVAFGRSLAAQLRFAHAVIDAATAGLLLRPRHLAGRGTDDADPHQLLLLDLLAEPAPPDSSLEDLAASARRDLRRLRALNRSLGRSPSDPKVVALDRLRRRLAPDKVVVFTEFRDTAEAIWLALLPTARVARIDGSGAWLGRRPSSRATVIRRFAPGAGGRTHDRNGADGRARGPAHAAREAVDVLVATDVLAEGLDLQDARHVVSFDLPWNPVRLLQRIGRVDRLGSPHDLVVPHLFVPDVAIDRRTRTTATLHAKLRTMIHAVGAEDADRLLARLFGGDLDGAGERGATAPRSVRSSPPETASVPRDPTTSPLESLRTLWRAAPHLPGHRRSPAARAASALSGRRRPDPPLVAAGACATPSAVALVRWRGTAWLLEWDVRRRELRDAGEGAARAVRQALGDAPAPRRGRTARGGPPVRPLFRILAEDVRRHFQALDAARAAPTALPPHDPAARLVRRLRGAIARAPLGVPRELIARVEALLGALDRPLPASLAEDGRRVEDAVSPGTALPDLVARLEALLGGRAPPETPAPGALEPAGEPRLEAVLFAAESPGSDPVDDARHAG